MGCRPPGSRELRLLKREGAAAPLCGHMGSTSILSPVRGRAASKQEDGCIKVHPFPSLFSTSVLFTRKLCALARLSLAGFTFLHKVPLTYTFRISCVGLMCMALLIKGHVVNIAWTHLSFLDMWVSCICHAIVSLRPMLQKRNIPPLRSRLGGS